MGNAIFDATGARMIQMSLMSDQVKNAMRES